MAMTTTFSASRCLAPRPVRSSPWCKRRCWQPCPMPGSATPFSRTRRWRRDSARSSRRCRRGPSSPARLSYETRTGGRVQPAQCSDYGVALGSDRIPGLAVWLSAGHWLDRADEVSGLRGARHPTAGGAQSLVELDVWIAHRRPVLTRARSSGGADRRVDRTATLVSEGLSTGQWRSGAHVSDDTLVCVLDAGMGAKPRWLSCALGSGGPIPGE